METRLIKWAVETALVVGALVRRGSARSGLMGDDMDSRESIPFEGSVVGIDVGWSEEVRTSAICRVSWGSRQIDWEIERFVATSSERETAIRRVAGENELCAVAIDGPLRSGFDVIGRYRSAERLLSRGELARRIGKPGQSSSPHGRQLNAQANHAAKCIRRICRVRRAAHALRIDEHAIVEAFPTTFLGSMVEFPARLKSSGKRSDRYFVHLAEHRSLDRFVEKLLPGRRWLRELRAIRNHEDRAALVCSLTALSVAAGEFAAVGDEEDGWIILPPQWAFADWAWTAICKTAEESQREAHAIAGRLCSFGNRR